MSTGGALQAKETALESLTRSGKSKEMGVYEVKGGLCVLGRWGQG